MTMRAGLFVLLFMLSLVDATAQTVSASPDKTCKIASAVTVTVFDSSGALLPNAFVLLRAGGYIGKEKPFQLELTTNSSGKATASVPCGYLDVFATANLFAPNAKKFNIDQDKVAVAISLDVFPITMAKAVDKSPYHKQSGCAEIGSGKACSQQLSAWGITMRLDDDENR